MSYNTKILKPTKQNTEIVIDSLKKGEVVALPTETVYGLAANIYDENAVKNIFIAKGRPQDNPLIVHVSNLDMLKELVLNISEDAKKLIKAFWPGALTIIFPKSDKVSNIITAGLDNVAIRMPLHKTALEIIEQSNLPLAMPSANLSGSPSPTCVQYVYDDMNGLIPYIVDGDDCVIGVESTVINLTSEIPVILRPGYITKRDIEKVLNKKILISNAVLDKLKEGEKVNSPGMKYKHYAPKANVIIIKATQKEYAKYVNSKKREGVYALCFNEDIKNLETPYISYGSVQNSISQAQQLFTALRKLDEKKAQIVYAHCPTIKDVGLAVYNRLIRAANFEIINLDKDGVKVIAVTGRSGVGKSYVSNILRENGNIVLDCDKIAKEALENKKCIDSLVNCFGTEILNDDKKINNKKLANKAFSNKDSVTKLTQITHPIIIDLLLQNINLAHKKGYKYIYVDGAVIVGELFEKYCDEFIVVLSDEVLQIERIVKRDKITIEEAKNRINKQVSLEKLEKISDYILYNNNDNIEKQILQIDDYLRGRYS